MQYQRTRDVLGQKTGFRSLVANHDVTLLHDGVNAFPVMLEAIGRARHEILLEMYWFASDKTGRKFATALMDKARAGVRVRVIYDAVGSFEADRDMFEELSEAGCEVREYNPIAPWRGQFRIGVVNNRDHRKLLIVDRRVGFTGGLNLGDVWAPEEEGGKGWRDDMVRIEGPAVSQMREIFLRTWYRIEARRPAASFAPPPLNDAKEALGESRVGILSNDRFRQRRSIRQAYLSEIRAAEDSIYITNSYFVPDAEIRRALENAVARGVEVRVMVPGRSDVPAVYYAGRSQYTRLIKKGIHVHEWRGPMLHAKTAVIDGYWCTVGTYNLDYRSWRLNLEVVAVIEDRALGEEMQACFKRDLQNAPEIELRAWRLRAPWERFLEGLFYLFRKLL